MEPYKCKSTHCEDRTRAPEASIISLEPSLQEDPRENHPEDDGNFSKPATPNWNYGESEEPIGYDELFDGSEEDQDEEIDNSGHRDKESTCFILSEPCSYNTTDCENCTRATGASIISLEPSLQEDLRENHPEDDGNFSKPATPNWTYGESEEPISYDELLDRSEENQAEEIDNSGQREKELTFSTLSEPCSYNPTDYENCTRDPDASIMDFEPSLQDNQRENHPEDDSSITKAEDNTFHHNTSQRLEQASKEYTVSSIPALNMDKTSYYEDSFLDSLDSNFSLSEPIAQDCPKEIHSGVPDECEASDGEYTDDEWDSSSDSDSEPCSYNPTDCENCTRDPDTSIMNLEPSLLDNQRENHPEGDSSVTKAEDNTFHHNTSQHLEQASKEYTVSSIPALNMDKTSYYEDSFLDSLDSNFSLSESIPHDCPKEIHYGVPDECEASDGEFHTSELFLKDDEFSFRAGETSGDEIHYSDLENEVYETSIFPPVKAVGEKPLKVSKKRKAEAELSDEERYIKHPRLGVEEANGGTININESEPKENKQGEDNHQENVNYNLTINNYYNGKQSESIHTATNSGYNKEETDKEN